MFIEDGNVPQQEICEICLFCVVYSVFMYWHTTSPNGFVGAWVEVSCVLSKREIFCSSHSRWSIQSNSSTGLPSLASTHCCKLFISLVCMSKSASLLGKRLPRWPSALDPLKAIAVSELFVLSLSLSGSIYMFLASSKCELRSLSLYACPGPLWQVVIAWVLYVAQYDWYLSSSSLSMVLSGENAQSLLLLGQPAMCSALYGSSMLQSLPRQEWS